MRVAAHGFARGAEIAEGADACLHEHPALHDEAVLVVLGSHRVDQVLPLARGALQEIGAAPGVRTWAPELFA